ncbi:MAG: trigger factor, partial [Patescibacteria group bacterium]|nr:trigger factor [Patescibacteria group bacterium]
YGVKALQNKKVTFDVTVQKVEEVIKPKVDEAFVKKVGAFDSVADLKKDIKKQLTLERGQQLDREYEDALVDEIVAHSTVSLPESMLKEQVEAMDSEFQQNLVYRGQTFQEYLEQNGLTEQSYKDTELLPAAKKRLTAGLVLSSISEKENITVSPEELEIRIQVLKGQHQNDNAMLKELEKPDARRSVTARMLTEKTIAKIVEYNKK